jgi:HAD superfamily hydrolase (TIGR01509 family)
LCYVRLFSEFGIDFTRQAFERTYSPDWYRTYEGIGLPRERWEEADARWLAIYAERPCGLLPRAGSALRRLKDAGLSTALVTSGSRPRVERDLAALDVAACFDAVVCSGDVAPRKPDPAPLRFALERLRVSPSRAAYVGDSPEDVEMARAAGVHSIAIPGGFPNREALARAEPDAWAEDLFEAVERLLGIVS